jgi:hypothetical protein
MAEMILPGVYIEVRPEGLIVPGRVTVGNLGVVGTASKGPVGQPINLGSYGEAREVFGDYDLWIDGNNNELTLVRALEQAFRHGATRAYAVRVASGNEAKAISTLTSASGDCVRLDAKSKGTWGKELAVNVVDAEEHALVEDEEVQVASPNLAHAPVVKSARNRIRVKPGGGGLIQTLQILYDDNPNVPVAGQVKVDRSSGALTFGISPDPADTVLASYMVDSSQAVKVTLQYGTSEEVFTVASGDDLVHDLAKDSSWVEGVALANSEEVPSTSTPPEAFTKFIGGDNGASGANFQAGLDKLLNVDAHIIVAAGQDLSFGDELASHCKVASSDELKRERIAVVGSGNDGNATLLSGHNLNSDRLIFVAPGIITQDTAATPPVDVELTGAYAAAAVAGLLAGLSPHISPTNKVLDVGGLKPIYTTAELKQLVQSRILVLEERQGFRIVKGITTSTNTAWHQITTRRIVDYAKYGVRSAALPYIGLLNNKRVRGALRTTINSFLAEMVDDEMLVSYELDVTATRDEERKGIARVTMVVRPTFSIDFIKVTMFLE